MSCSGWFLVSLAKGGGWCYYSKTENSSHLMKRKTEHISDTFYSKTDLSYSRCSQPGKAHRANPSGAHDISENKHHFFESYDPAGVGYVCSRTGPKSKNNNKTYRFNFRTNSNSGNIKYQHLSTISCKF